MKSMQTHILKLGAVLMVIFGFCLLTGWLSSAEAVITIRSAEVVNGAAVVNGGNAARSAPVYWEGGLVTQANNGRNFSFQGIVPADCVGRLEGGVPADAIDVALANCTPVPPVEFPAPVPQTWQTQCSVTQPMRPEPSPASGRLASRLTGTFQGQLFHPWGASPKCYGPTAHRLPVQAMEVSSHYIMALRGAPLSTHQLVRDAWEQHSNTLSQSRMPRSICS